MASMIIILLSDTGSDSSDHGVCLPANKLLVRNVEKLFRVSATFF